MTLSISVSKVDDLGGAPRRNLIMAALRIATTQTADSSERICVQQKFKRRRSVVREVVRLGCQEKRPPTVEGAARLARTSARLGVRTSAASPLAWLRALICFDV